MWTSLCIVIVITATGLPPLPQGSRLAINAPGWGRGIGTGGAVWPAAETLCQWLLEEQRLVQGASVLELGSGTGAVGIFAAGCGASHVLLTDGDESLVSLAAENAQNNRALLPDANVNSRRYRWGSTVDGLGGPFDLCLCSDITYEPGYHAPLIKTLSLLLEAPAEADGGREQRPPPRVLLAHTHRPLTSVLKGSGCMEHLYDTARLRGLAARELRTARAGMAVVSLIEFETTRSSAASSELNRIR